MAVIQKANDEKCWNEYGERGTLAQCGTSPLECIHETLNKCMNMRLESLWAPLPLS